MIPDCVPLLYMLQFTKPVNKVFLTRDFFTRAEMLTHKMLDSEWEDWANVYVRHSANIRHSGRSSSRSVGESVAEAGEALPMDPNDSEVSVSEVLGAEVPPMSRQAVRYRVRALEDQARRMAYMCARSAALRELFLTEFVNWTDEPWFETYDGLPLESVDAVVERLTGKVRSAYP